MGSKRRGSVRPFTGIPLGAVVIILSDDEGEAGKGVCDESGREEVEVTGDTEGEKLVEEEKVMGEVETAEEEQMEENEEEEVEIDDEGEQEEEKEEGEVEAEEEEEEEQEEKEEGEVETDEEEQEEEDGDVEILL
ncbi:unnamed protein product [Closterium sp. NIES-65]|nr:unnamed protein product [Closterium sp. NIES-65]